MTGSAELFGKGQARAIMGSDSDDAYWEAKKAADADAYREAEEAAAAAEYQDLCETVVQEFTAERLQSYFTAHPQLARPAVESLLYAQSLRPSFPKAALVFAVTAAELAVKTVLLKPIIFGLVHTEALASFITDLATQHAGMERFQALIAEILARFGGLDVKTYKRAGSVRTLWQEIGEVQKTRNSVVHRGQTVDDSSVDLAITVASALLNDIFPQVLGKLGLGLDGSMSVCAFRDAPGGDSRNEGTTPH
jgi:hypothetical protein